MTTTVHEVKQRSPEWFDLRTGMVTASTIGALIIATKLGAIAFKCPACEAEADKPCLSKRSGKQIATLHPERAAAARQENVSTLALADNETTRGLAATLAAERIAGIDPDTGYINRDMERGITVEPLAIHDYERHYNTQVQACGFMTLAGDGYELGFSPDGLVGDQGLIEIKSPRQRGHLLAAVSGDPGQHMAQIQTGLLVSGRAWCDLISYSPGMRMWVKRVEPDPEWSKAIEAAARAVEAAITDLISDYLTAVEGFPTTDRLPNDLGLEF